MSTLDLSVPEIHCEHCKTSIEGAVGALPGVDRVAVSIDSRTVAVDFAEGAVDRTAVVAAIEDQGYSVP